MCKKTKRLEFLKELNFHKTKIILIFIILNTFAYSHNASEYSLGLSDKLGIAGLLTKSWVYNKEYNELSFFLGTTFFITGGAGISYKRYLSTGDFAPYFNIALFSYYIADGMSSNPGTKGSDFNISAALGVDITAINWKENKIKLSAGLIAMHDLINKTTPNIIIGADNGPGNIMPTINLKMYFGGK